MAMSQSEIDALIAKIEAGTYTLDTAEKDIANAAKGADVREAIYALPMLLANDGVAGCVDAQARSQIASLLGTGMSSKTVTTYNRATLAFDTTVKPVYSITGLKSTSNYFVVASAFDSTQASDDGLYLYLSTSGGDDCYNKCYIGGKNFVAGFVSGATEVYVAGKATTAKSYWTYIYAIEMDDTAIAESVHVSNTNILDTEFDLNDCVVNEVYTVSCQCVNMPSESGGTIVTLAHKTDAVDTYSQVLYDTNGHIWSRYNQYKEGWTDWRRVGMKAYGDSVRMSLFDRVGVVGDSYASGEIYSTDGSTNLGDKYRISWPQQLARRNGFTAVNFSRGGLTVSGASASDRWLNDSWGLSYLNSQESCGLYIVALGINDYWGVRSASDTEVDAYIGKLSDIESSADTFYGNFGKIVNAIKAKGNAVKIIISNIAVPYTSGYKTLIAKFNTAINAIAEYFEIPLLDQAGDYYFSSKEYSSAMYGGHPSAIGYSAMATEMERLVGECMYSNSSYFEAGDFDTDTSVKLSASDGTVYATFEEV